MTHEEEVELLHLGLGTREKVYPHTDCYSDLQICYDIHRIACNLADEGYINDARKLENILATLKKRYGIKDEFRTD